MSAPPSNQPCDAGSLRKRFEPQISRLGGSDTAKAAGLAGAMVANNVIALGSVIVFSRELSDYGSLAALVSYFLDLWPSRGTRCSWPPPAKPS